MGGDSRRRGAGETAGSAPFMAPSVPFCVVLFCVSFQAAARSCEGLSPAKVEEYLFASPRGDWHIKTN